MVSSLKTALEYARRAEPEALRELQDWLRIPSISNVPEFQPQIQQAADWAAQRLRHAGLKRVNVLATDGHPLVVGEAMSGKDHAPTILVYGHYDVQTPEPIDAWLTPPFDPVVRGDRLFARGATDMKGQVMASLMAIEAWIKTAGLPVNVRVVIEGEEEQGSPNLAAAIRAHPRRFSGDVMLNPDAGMLGREIPTIVYGLRGVALAELTVRGPASDLHSGSFGGVIHNPVQALVGFLAGLHDEHGRVTVPGFYDAVRPLAMEERQSLARLPMDEAFYLERSGVPKLWGEPDYTPVERAGARPTLEMTMIRGGERKSAIPATALARISMRLVPDQRPGDILTGLRQACEKRLPDTVTWELKVLSRSAAALTDLKTVWVKAMSDALSAVWAKEVVLMREGGTIAVVSHMQEMLGVDSVLTGFALPEDNLHGPNESVHLPTLWRGVEAMIRFFDLAARPASSPSPGGV
jgi:acetylornithine deacetylase/succinyl-diaminopimelate desuccinylase-like protein